VNGWVLEEDPTRVDLSEDSFMEGRIGESSVDGEDIVSPPVLLRFGLGGLCRAGSGTVAVLLLLLPPPPLRARLLSVMDSRGEREL
jgi:hypothetical protein